MRRRLFIVLVPCCCAALHLVCFFPVLFQDRQFGFRDAAHYYYPLYQRVQKDWNEGRWPLWEPEENAGMPLLGNPTAAVLYPGKIIYAALPYPWAARAYVIAHTMLAYVAMLILMRSWGTSWAGSGLSAMAYAFGVPVLFQNCNIIYLVGAAWLPLGFHAVDRWARLGRRWGLLELAVVLAMQTLGGDPQSSYLLGLAAFGYAIGLAAQRRPGDAASDAARAAEPDAPTTKPRGLIKWWLPPLLLIAFAAWALVTLLLARWLPTLRPKGFPPPALPWMRHVPQVVAGVWTAAAAVFLWKWRRRGGCSPLGVTWLGLLGAAFLALVLSSAQLLPVLEFIRATSRATGEGLHDIYPFSVEPLRLVLLFWPNVLGTSTGINTYWGDAARLPGQFPKPWVTSFYAGCLVFVLAVAGWGRQRGAPWRAWLSIILVISLLGALGKYTSPIWGARVFEALTGRPAARALVAEMGGLDPENSTPIRHDGFLRDGDGSFYWWLSNVLPGFRQFRYPAKLFTFTSLALAALAGAGWDDLLAGRLRRRVTWPAAFLLMLSVALLVGACLARGAILSAFRGTTAVGLHGPLDPSGAHAAILKGLAQAAAVLAVGLAAVRLARARPGAASAIVLLVTTADIAVANARHVVTVPQSIFDTVPEAARIIAEAERAHPAPGPYRIHRMAIWDPFWWATTSTPDRAREIDVWERDSLQPKYGINYGIEFVHTFGVAELYDYDWYFGPFYRSVRDERMARVLNIKLGEKVVYFPRRSFNMWNARYFVVPMLPNGWGQEIRGYASFLLDAERIYPGPDELGGADDVEARRAWAERHDFQILRNRAEHPRAWVVHQARAVKPIAGLSKNERKLAMQEITYADDPIWNDPTMKAFDPLQLAWVEASDARALSHYLRGGPPGRSEPVQIHCPGPQRVELDVDLRAPGLVVLADVFYPGWKLTIDGKPAPIYRVNRLMRGAAVPANKHHLVYTYEPGSFRIGCTVSLAGLGLLGLLSVYCAFRPASPVLAARPLDRPPGEAPA